MAKRRRKRPPRRHPPVLPIGVVRRTTWRDPRTGRKTGPPKKGKSYKPGTRPKREYAIVQVDAKGRIVRTIEQIGTKKVIKTSIAGSHGSVDAPFRPGTQGSGEQGLIDPALANTNVYTRMKGAKIMTLVVKGRDPGGRSRVITKKMFTVGVKHIRAMMVRGILDAMREAGYRTQYQLSMVDWGSLTPDLRAGVRINTRAMVQRLTPLANVDIQVTLEK